MNILYRCPQCPDIQQGVGLSNERIRQILDSGEDFTVMGLQCGHVWKLTNEEVEAIRKAMDEE